jgi:hypothetical protein
LSTPPPGWPGFDFLELEAAGDHSAGSPRHPFQKLARRDFKCGSHFEDYFQHGHTLGALEVTGVVPVQVAAKPPSLPAISRAFVGGA